VSATTGLARSVQVRLGRHARTIDADLNLVLARYGTERFLYRLSRSPYAERFVLKGALLLLVWLGETFRPTRDADLLGFGDMSGQSVAEMFRECCALEVEPDGLVFDPGSVSVGAIRAEDIYGGQRAIMRARLGSARIKVQADVGIGDAVEPPAEWLDYPSLLDLPRPRLRAYRPETVVAEKLHTMVALGAINSRMRDFFDVHALAARESFDGARLVRALRATFERRRTAIPQDLPLALTPAFAQVDGKRVQWAAFLAKNRVTAAPKDLAVTVAEIATFALPVMRAANRTESFGARWTPGGPWR
jgi:nucleotidyltransferase AbiEii toxin of type IV toxin-antitoxin system